MDINIHETIYDESEEKNNRDVNTNQPMFVIDTVRFTKYVKEFH